MFISPTGTIKLETEHKWRPSQGDIMYNYQMLATAIIIRALKDYQRVLIRMINETDAVKMSRLVAEKTEIEDFMHSDWYQILTDLDADKLLEAVKKNAIERAIAREKKRRRGMKENITAATAVKDTQAEKTTSEDSMSTSSEVTA